MFLTLTSVIEGKLDIICEATQGDLISIQNPAYMRIYLENQNLLSHVQSLMYIHQFSLMHSRYILHCSDVLQMFTSAQRLPSSVPTTEVIQDTTPLNKEDYPKVKYWKKTDSLEESNK